MKDNSINTYEYKYCRQVIEYMRTGKPLVAFAASILKSMKTLKAWRSMHPEFNLACEIGETLCESFWDREVREQAIGEKRGNSKALLAYMQNHFRWATKQEISGVDGKAIQISKLSDRELDERIAELSRDVDFLF